MAGLFFKNHGQNCGSKIPLIHRLNIKNTTFELNPLFENIDDLILIIFRPCPLQH